MNTCQIITKYLNGNTNYRQKTVVPVEPGTGSIKDGKSGCGYELLLK